MGAKRLRRQSGVRPVDSGRWCEVSVAVADSGCEAVAAALEAAGSAGGQFLAPAGARGSRSSASRVLGYFPAGERLPERLEDLAARLEVLSRHGVRPLGPPTSRMLDETEWSTAWKAFYHPIRIGRRLVIAPSWEPAVGRGDDLVIRLDPGMAFGTGTHPTTALCLAALEDAVLPGHRVLDWGTGSGILAIAAAALGARRVLALDTDPVAVAAARANARANGVAGRVRISEADLPAGGRFDVVAANIVAETILPALGRLRSLLVPGGAAVLSGIIEPRAGDLRDGLGAAGFDGAVGRREGEWICLTARAG